MSNKTTGTVPCPTCGSDCKQIIGLDAVAARSIALHMNALMPLEQAIALALSEAGFTTQTEDEALQSAADKLAIAADGREREIERLRTCLKYQDDREAHIGTHGPGCYAWGPRHYECALGRLSELAALTEEVERLRTNTVSAT